MQTREYVSEQIEVLLERLGLQQGRDMVHLVHVRLHQQMLVVLDRLAGLVGSGPLRKGLFGGGQVLSLGRLSRLSTCVDHLGGHGGADLRRHLCGAV